MQSMTRSWSRKRSSSVAPLRYMLDTNVVSILIRRPHSELAARVAALPKESYAVSVIVAGELLYGAARRGFRAID